ncbi:RNA polymerase sigma factor [Saccharothrix hoggarensis]|uniref:RNA polymerase sigma factor n=1 Tax=Saccharothrix hoggarensis TaxID=913853 RepID=A0ABW3QYC8_9PSEU
MDACPCSMCKERDRCDTYTFVAEAVQAHHQEDLERACAKVTADVPRLLADVRLHLHRWNDHSCPSDVPVERWLDKIARNVVKVREWSDWRVYGQSDFAELHRAYEKKIRLRARGMGLDNPADLDDVVQEVFLKFYRHLRVPGALNPLALLGKMTGQQVNRQNGKSHRRREVLKIDDERTRDLFEQARHQPEYDDDETVSRWTAFALDVLRTHGVRDDLPLDTFARDNAEWLDFCTELKAHASGGGRRGWLDGARVVGETVAALACLDHLGGPRHQEMREVLDSVLGAPNRGQSMRRGWKYLQPLAAKHNIVPEDGTNGRTS